MWNFHFPEKKQGGSLSLGFLKDFLHRKKLGQILFYSRIFYLANLFFAKSITRDSCDEKKPIMSHIAHIFVLVGLVLPKKFQCRWNCIDIPIHPLKFPVGPASGYLSGFRFLYFWWSYQKNSIRVYFYWHTNSSIKFPVGLTSGYLSGFRFPIFALLIDFCEIIALERIFRLVNFRKQLNSNKGYTKFQFEKVDSKLYVEVEILWHV